MGGWPRRWSLCEWMKSQVSRVAEFFSPEDHKFALKAGGIAALNAKKFKPDAETPHS